MVGVVGSSPIAPTTNEIFLFVVGVKNHLLEAG